MSQLSPVQHGCAAAPQGLQNPALSSPRPSSHPESSTHSCRCGFHKFTVVFCKHCIKNKTKKIQIGHHTIPSGVSATAPLRTEVDMCRTGEGAGKRAEAKSEPVRRRSNHARTEDRALKRKCANTGAVGGWRVHTADDTPSRNAATRSKNCNFMCQGDIRPRAAAGSSRNGTTQAVASTTGIRLLGNTASNTAPAWSEPELTRKRSSRRRAIMGHHGRHLWVRCGRAQFVVRASSYRYDFV